MPLSLLWGGRVCGQGRDREYSLRNDLVRWLCWAHGPRESSEDHWVKLNWGWVWVWVEWWTLKKVHSSNSFQRSWFPRAVPVRNWDSQTKVRLCLRWALPWFSQHRNQAVLPKTNRNDRQLPQVPDHHWSLLKALNHPADQQTEVQRPWHCHEELKMPRNILEDEWAWRLCRSGAWLNWEHAWRFEYLLIAETIRGARVELNQSKEN